MPNPIHPARRAGYTARMSAVSHEANPYSETASEEDVRESFTHWQAGWEQADQDPRAPHVRYCSLPDHITMALIRANSLLP